MGACREGFDLANKYQRGNFWRSLLRGRFQRYMWGDTFGRVLCWLKGEHVLHQDFSETPHTTSCYVCGKWLEQDGYKWRVKRFGS
jgi:hypothetical protein